MITLNFTSEVVLEDNECHVQFNQEHKIVVIKWFGIVDLPTAQNILMKGSNFIEDGRATRILLDRRNLNQFSKEASKWIRDDLLRNRAKKLVHLVDKVATVKPRTAIGTIFSNVVSTAIRIVFPGLRMKSYDNQVEAFEWLIEE